MKTLAGHKPTYEATNDGHYFTFCQCGWEAVLSCRSTARDAYRWHAMKATIAESVRLDHVTPIDSGEQACQ